MLDSIKNVLCIGRNYPKGTETASEKLVTPVVFSKPTHSLVPIEGKPILLPAQQGKIFYEAEIVLHVAKPYQQGMGIDDLIDKMALGIDFSLKDVQNELSKKGHPWLKAKGFINAAPITKFIDFKGFEAVRSTDFSLVINEVEVQRGKIDDMIISLQEVIEYCGSQFSLDVGDVIFTGSPMGAGAVADGDKLELFWDNKPAGDFQVKLG